MFYSVLILATFAILQLINYKKKTINYIYYYDYFIHTYRFKILDIYCLNRAKKLLFTIQKHVKVIIYFISHAKQKYYLNLIFPIFV